MKKDAKIIAIHIFLLLASSLLFAFLVAYQFYISAFVMVLLLALQIIYLFWSMNKNTKRLKQFIWAIQYSDFQVGRPGNPIEKEKYPSDLSDTMEKALQQYKKHLQQKESQLQYFQALADHIDLSVFVLTKNGEIEWMNLAARFQTGLQAPKMIDDLVDFHPELPARLRSLHPGDISILQVVRGDECFQLALSAMSFAVLGKTLTVVSMKNIRTVLENKETEAWQKLIRVLTHEIMNSMTPIVSLSELLKDNYRTGKNMENKEEEEKEETQQALETIHRRSNGLLRFVENYRKVIGIPSPVLQVIPVSDLLDSVLQLMKTEAEGLRVLPISVHLQVIADKGQIEQVLINLIKNAKEATSETLYPSIELSAGINSEGRTFIQVSDNGSGIPSDVLERIFVPFFTTKPAGSGIGLSLSRQIMHMHKGSLTATSEIGKGSRFILTFH